MKYVISFSIFLSSLLIQNSVFCQSFTTYSMDAPMVNTQLTKAEVASCIDQYNNTHIAWIKDNGNARYLMHTVFDAQTKQFNTNQINAGDSAERKNAPYIIVDENEGVHIVYFVKRDPNGSILKSGNYAIMYAGDPEGDGTFNIDQVSLNPTDPTVDNEDIYNCDVNGRPNVLMESGTLIVTYVGQSSSLTNYDSYLVVAEKQGSSWNRSQGFNTDDLGGTFQLSDGLSAPNRTTNFQHLGYVEISNYNPSFMYYDNGNYTEVAISGYDGVFGNEHVQLVTDDQGTLHYFWFNDEDSKFCHTTISDSTYTTVKETPVLQNTTGSFFPATVDLSTSEPIYFYDEGFGEAWMITFDQNNDPVETEITDIGLVHGRKSLWANNGYISLVTASVNSDKLYLTTNDNIGPSSVSENEINNFKFKIFPNPAKEILTLQNFHNVEAKVEIINAAGIVVYESNLQNQLNSISIDAFESGFYMIRLLSNMSVIYTERLIIQ